MGDTQTAGMTDARTKWAKSFTGVDLDKSKGAAAPPPVDERVAKLDKDYEAAVASKNWSSAAELLNAFNTGDIKARLSKRSAAEVASLHEGAAGNAKVGPQSNAALMTAPPGGGGASSGGPLVDPPIPKDSPGSKAKFVKAVQAFTDGIKPSTNASGLYDVTVGGKTTQISQKDYDAALKKFSDRIRDLLGRAFSKAEGGMGLYNQKKKTDNEWWLTSHIVNTLGRVKDPGPFLTGAYADASKAHAAALAALAKPDLVAAAAAMSDCEYASVKTQLLAQVYFEATISAGEMQIAVLEGVEQGCEWSLTFLAVVATAGGAAVAIEAGTVAAVAKTGLQTANKAALGKPIDWADVTVEFVIELVFVRFGGGLEDAIGEAVIGKVAKEYGGRYAKEAIKKALTEIYKVTLRKVVAATIKKYQPSAKQMTGEELATDVATDLQKSDSLIAEMAKAVVEVLAHGH